MIQVPGGAGSYKKLWPATPNAACGHRDGREATNPSCHRIRPPCTDHGHGTRLVGGVPAFLLTPCDPDVRAYNIQHT